MHASPAPMHTTRKAVSPTSHGHMHALQCNRPLATTTTILACGLTPRYNHQPLRHQSCSSVDTLHSYSHMYSLIVFSLSSRPAVISRVDLLLCRPTVHFLHRRRLEPPFFFLLLPEGLLEEEEVEAAGALVLASGCASACASRMGAAGAAGAARAIACRTRAAGARCRGQ